MDHSRAMIFIALGLLTLKSYAFADSAWSQFPSRAMLPQTVSNKTAVGGSISARKLFHRQETCDAGYSLCPDDIFCCPSGTSCCEDSYSCADPGDTCCSFGTCPSGWGCCGDFNCAPDDGQCCDDGSYCDAGYICVIYDGFQTCCTDLSCSEFESGSDTSSYSYPTSDYSTPLSSISVITTSTEDTTTASASITASSGTPAFTTEGATSAAGFSAPKPSSTSSSSSSSTSTTSTSQSSATSSSSDTSDGVTFLPSLTAVLGVVLALVLVQ